MKHVRIVHGMANKPAAALLRSLWLRVLECDDPKPELHRRANPGVTLNALGATCDMVYWADVLYPEPKEETSEDERSILQERTIEGLPVTFTKSTVRGKPADAWRRGLSKEERSMVVRLERQLRFEIGLERPAVRRATRATALERVPLPES